MYQESSNEAIRSNMLKVADQSTTFRKIGSYFEANWEKLLFVSASEVAQKADVSQGSVSRFCAELGYVGFAEFQKSLQQSKHEAFSTVKRVQNLKGISNEVQELLEEEKAGINKLPEVIASKDFESIVNAVISSKRVILISGRMSATIVTLLKYHLQKIRDNVISVTPEDAQWDLMETNSPEDCFVLAITFPRYYAALIRKLEALQKAGYKIGLISDSLLSPAIPYADYHLELPMARKSVLIPTAFRFCLLISW